MLVYENKDTIGIRTQFSGDRHYLYRTLGSCKSNPTTIRSRPRRHPFSNASNEPCSVNDIKNKSKCVDR